MNSYQQQSAASQKSDLIFCVILFGITMGILFGLDLPPIWHISVLVAVGFTLLVVSLSYNVQQLLSQIHISAEYTVENLKGSSEEPIP